ncbi:DUF2711 family protein [Bhargavaea ginsengi]|uniref:DUF2711 family protein n=1 Tax=Bhargavaea ginsengi TaxID=426757 RepID=UPI003C7625A1
MEEEVRHLPPPHRYAVCSNDEVPIKSFYQDIFSDVFIFFHPFIKPVTLPLEQYFSDPRLGKQEIMRHCEAVGWQEFLSLSGIKSVRQLDIGLRTGISGLKEKYADEQLAERVFAVCAEHRLVPPTEGFLPELLINDVLGAVKKEGYEWLWVGDEFCTERKLEYIDDLITGDMMERNNLFTHDQSLLITTHWDSHFSMICSNDRKRLGRIVQDCNLEGFYCDDRTEIYWSVRN